MRLLALGSIVVLLSALPAAAGAGAEGLAYDQISRVLIDATPPPPNSFAEDEARIALLPPLSAGPPSAGMAGSQALGMLSAIPVVGLFAGVAHEVAMMAYVKAVQAYTEKVTAEGKAYRNAGTLQHVWYYHGWSRLDNVGAHSAMIDKPDKGEQIFLDLAGKKYQVATAQLQQSNVETYEASDDEGLGTPTDLTLQGRETIERLPAMDFSGETARGYRATATFATSKAIGWCGAGIHELSEVEFVADIPDPQAAAGPGFSIERIAREACEPTTAGSHDEPGHLFLFRSTALSHSVIGDIVVVTERAKIHHFNAPGAFFEIPSGFTEEHKP